MSMTTTPDAVLQFWFGEDVGSSEAIESRQALWFGGDPAIDERIRERFDGLPSRAARGKLDSWRSAPRSSLALVLVVDQFPRNLYRGRAESFAYDRLAREVATEALAERFDSRLTPVEAMFLYLPFEHAEDVEAQERSVSLFQDLLARAPVSQRPQFESFLSYALRHRDIILRFGRFPHRNSILGRASTSEEISYLESGGDTF